MTARTTAINESKTYYHEDKSNKTIYRRLPFVLGICNRIFIGLLRAESICERVRGGQGYSNGFN